MNPVHVTLAACFAVLFVLFFVYVAFQLKSPDPNDSDQEKPTSTER